jgi:hypothetical protein
VKHFLVTLLALLSISAGQAGNVIFPSCFQYYNTGSYSGAPSYYPNSGNTYAYNPYYAQKVVAQEIAVAPLIVTVPVDSAAVPIANYGVNHYWSVQEAYQQQQSIRAAVREELRAILGAQPQQPFTNTPQPQPQPTPAPAPATKVTDLGIDTSTPTEVAQPLIASMNQNCFKCHGAVENDLKGNLRLLYKDANGLRLAQQTVDRKWHIYGVASTGIMPPSAQQDATKAVPQNQLLAWFRWASAR